ncbi:MAG: hypothetical protein FWF16_04195, partial [Microbacteriaceae bacterium]|nr:hypothetical protein [Microbacteriaceae bacterium]
MTMDFESLDIFGAPLEHVETYVYYQGRRTFAMRSRTLDLYYFVNTVDEDESAGTLTTVLAAADPARFRAVRSGLVPFRSAFTDVPSHGLYSATWSWPDDADVPVATVEEIVPGTLPDSWLPGQFARLDLSTTTELNFDEVEVVNLARAQQRTVFAIEVGGAGNITQFPGRASGELQIAVSREFDALAAEVSGEPNVRGLVPMFAGVRAASFVMLWAIESDQVFEPTDLTESVFRRLADLIAAASSGENAEVLSEMRKHTNRVRNRFKEMLQPLVSNGSGLTLVSSIASSGSVVKTRASASEVKTAYEAIEAAFEDPAF